MTAAMKPLRATRFGFLFCATLASAGTTSGCATSSSTQEEQPDPTAMEATPQSQTDVKLRDAINGAHRVKGNRGRDRFQHPLLTLQFFELREDMHVVELFTGYGYFAEILGPVLQEKGKLVVTGGDPNGPAEDFATKQAQYIQ